ncbi:guanine nucleotide-binding protein-like 1 [Ctenocephalides felis]|uniref:guanine nucleotide-binding protein-like 1 n=1 Tax=Ctenocephalides felis TaxID=7515 RepID=UPI000E6E2FF9|nr:guanine nucleotide-binding protein-like 1 [Ctenocephalides felis]
MPQGRRKVPFSGKAKKLQLQMKRQGQTSKSSVLLKTTQSQSEDDSNCQKIDFHASQNNRNTSRYALKFNKTALEIRDHKALEIEEHDYFKNLDFPKRPPWNYNMSLEEIQKSEHRYFTEYVTELEKSHENLSYFELNLETWRQLWRVLEMSDIILTITDIRYPSLMFPPYLYEYVTKELKKQMIFILNKVDLVPAPLVCAWYNHFKDKYPEMHILLFTSYPGYNVVRGSAKKTGLKSRKLKGRPQMSTEGAECLLAACKTIVKDAVDLSSWEQKIKEEKNSSSNSEELEIETVINQQTQDTAFVEHELYKNGILTIGCIGQPNVGKSSLMNALMGKKVVSVSKTPGHTKHFQTIFLTDTVRLCDCPGLVFPSLVPRYIQVLMGSYPISQLRETFSTLRFVAERLDLPKLLHLIHPDGDEEWSPYNICEAWAIKRGFLTARAARPDIHRAGINLLQMCLSGVICLKLKPPHYEEMKGQWEVHKDLPEIHKIQARTNQPEVDDEIDFEDFSEDDEVNDETKTIPKDQNADEDSSDSELPAIQNKFAALMD